MSKAICPQLDVPLNEPADRGGSLVHRISLVIPGRNCAATLPRCLDSVVPLLDTNELHEIIFVDDGSVDATAEIAQQYRLSVIAGSGRGPGAARNLGWKSATGTLIWFIDADCVAEPEAMSILLTHFNDPDVAAAGGSYTNLFPESLLASLIHEEIVARHRRMNGDVNFLATFNVLYRRSVLESVGGFDESLKLAQDAELAYRIRDCGHRLCFNIASRVGHHHPTNLWRYLKTQARQGYYRMLLYQRHPRRMSGDSYAGLVDYVQPPLAMACLISTPLLFGWCFGAATLGILPAILLAILLSIAIPMSISMVGQTGDARALTFPLFAVIRSVARGLGMTHAVLSRFRGPFQSAAVPTVPARQGVR